MTEVRECDAHGYVVGDSCPICSDAGTVVLGSDRRTRLSKFLSGALRHFPGDAGLELDDQGWTPYDALVDAAVGKYDWARPEHVAAVIATDPKGRFERDVDRVRAAYGHSVDVDLDAEATPVPDELYHGTAPDNLASIRAEGLRPMSRQKVHLSGSIAEAREVGRRHAVDPAVLAIDAAAMREDGLRVVKRGRETYTTDRVPPEYLRELGE
ncbi:RNA 2'-phosphotransferase [Natronoarchaeum mannanilyticum]|uniref:Probable RNA 2'-phosphotransferase n=1 Tax=Natronoarchaeum mannanilyticum TaxID=926360 RepID=A0AAV3TCN9_9EURY